MIISQEPTKAYRNGWDKIFNKKESKMLMKVSDFKIGDEVKVIRASNMWLGATGKVMRVTDRYVFLSPNKRQSPFWQKYYEKYGACFAPQQLEIIKKEEVSNMNTTLLNPPVIKADISVAHLLSLISIIESFIKNEQMFTCWDVTKSLKAEGFVVPHNQVRDFVHGLHNNDSVILYAWVRNTHTFPLKSGTMTAEVYAPEWLNLDDYDPYAVGDGSTPTVTPVVAMPAPISGAIIPSTTQKNTGSTVNAGIPAVAKSAQRHVAAQTAAKVNPSPGRTERDARGRLCIPNGMVRKMGLRFGDIAYIHSAGFGLTLRATTCQSQKYLTSLKVDKDDNVRITRKALDKAGVARSESSLVVSIDNNKTSIIITR